MTARRLRRTFALILLATGGQLNTPRSLPAQTSPSGIWRTISDTDGKPGAIVEIVEANGVVSGVILRSLAPNDSGMRVCDKCAGELHGQRLVGMRILNGLHLDGKDWSGGTILDPDTGRLYKAKIRLSDDGQSLTVRGFIGFSMLGRSQTWHREK